MIQRWLRGMGTVIRQNPYHYLPDFRLYLEQMSFPKAVYSICVF
jgi:hypothetical protein